MVTRRGTRGIPPRFRLCLFQGTSLQGPSISTSYAPDGLCAVHSILRRPGEDLSPFRLDKRLCPFQGTCRPNLSSLLNWSGTGTTAKPRGYVALTRVVLESKPGGRGHCGNDWRGRMTMCIKSFLYFSLLAWTFIWQWKMRNWHFSHFGA